MEVYKKVFVSRPPPSFLVKRRTLVNFHFFWLFLAFLGFLGIFLGLILIFKQLFDWTSLNFILILARQTDIMGAGPSMTLIYAKSNLGTNLKVAKSDFSKPALMKKQLVINLGLDKSVSFGSFD